MTTQTTTVLNGLDTQQMVDTIEAIRRQPSLARFQFRARNHGSTEGATDRASRIFMEPAGKTIRALRLSSGQLVPFKPIPSIDALTQAGAAVRTSRDPQAIGGGFFFLSGEVPRVTPYEQGLPNHLCRTEDGRDWEPDPRIMDERFLAVQVKGKGLVIFTACSHAGVVNVPRHARALFPEIPLHAVMGGFHLSGPGPERIIPDTVRDLAGLNVKHIIPGHCTGWRAVTALVNAFGEAVVMPSAVGKGYTF
jgi:7,8-dihydropterin-6-yl-methyl-4-(beta-D-ribofuranosyl)aminobenzene 5'-phosphate synthase